MAEKTNNRKTAHKAAFPVGLIIILLAAVGIVTIVVASVSGINSAVQKHKNFDEYNKLLTPVVLIDPDTFDDITKADMNELIEISVWSLLKSDISPDKYENTENGIIIPKADVEAQFIKLFGTEVAPVHGTAEGYGYEFTYDGKTESYIIPLTGIVPLYTPKVVDKSSSSGTLVLTVACLPGDAWEQGEGGQMKEPQPDKYLKITLRTKDEVQYISAIQATNTPETAETEPASEPPAEELDLIGKAEQVATDAASPTEEQPAEKAE